MHAIEMHGSCISRHTDGSPLVAIRVVQYAGCGRGSSLISWILLNQVVLPVGVTSPPARRHFACKIAFSVLPPYGWPPLQCVITFRLMLLSVSRYLRSTFFHM